MPTATLWFGTHSRGLSRYRPAQNRFDPPFLDFLDLRINALEPRGDILYVGSERGVSAFVISKEEVKETYRRLGALPKDTEVTSIEVFAGRLWAGTVNGLVWADLHQPNLQDPSSWEAEPIGGAVRDMLVYQDTLFVSATDGLWRVHPALDRPALDYSTTSSVALGLFEGRIVSATADGSLFQREGTDRWQAAQRKRHQQRRGPVRYRRPPVGGQLERPARPRHRPTAAAPRACRQLLLRHDPGPPMATCGSPRWPRTICPPLACTSSMARAGPPTPRGPICRPISSRPLATDAEGLLWVGTWGRGIDVRDANGQVAKSQRQQLGPRRH